MNSYLCNAVLLLVSLSMAVPVIAGCPEGKSEVVIVTPSGISKTICVSDNAIPGIENAAEHSAQFAIEPECPCLDVWDGTPYPEGTEVAGSPPLLPADLSQGICLAHTSVNHDSIGYVQVVTNTLTTFGADSRTTVGQSPGICTAYDQADPQNKADLESKAIFSDWKYSPGDLYTSPTMDACKALLEDRGCVFL